MIQGNTYFHKSKAIKTVEDKIKRIELVKKEIEFLNNLNNQVSLK